MHGLGASRQQTLAAFKGFANRYVIAPDLPGHGDSLDFDPTTFTFDVFADRVIDLMNHLEIPCADLGGLSMGSGIALNLALRYPDRVNRLIVLRPSWLDEVRPDHLHLVARVGQWIHEVGREKAQVSLALDTAYQTLQSVNPPVAASILALFDRSDGPASTQVLFRMWESRPFKALADLAAVSNPSLVLDTTRDELHPQSVAERIAAALPEARFHTLPPRYHQGEAYRVELLRRIEMWLPIC